LGFTPWHRAREKTREGHQKENGKENANEPTKPWSKRHKRPGFQFANAANGRGKERPTAAEGRSVIPKPLREGKKKELLPDKRRR